jgi:cystathionine gamma-synthase
METRAVEAGRSSASGAPLNAPLVPASSFRIGAEREYSRNDGTPTWEAFEAVVGALERAEAVAFSSGMAAIVAVFDQLPVGGRIAWPEDCYHGVAGIIADGERLGRWTASRLAVEDTDAWCEAAASADLTWIESPSNPLLHVADLRRIASIPRPDGAFLAIDNTLAGPLVQQPLDLGVDIAVQSATKHLGGHSNHLCGVATTRRAELAARLRKHRELRGSTPGTLETFLATRGLRTIRCAPPLQQPRRRSSLVAWKRPRGSSECATPASNRIPVMRSPNSTSRTSAVSSRSTWREAPKLPTWCAAACS